MHQVEEIHAALQLGEPKAWYWDSDGDEIIGRAVRKESRDTENGPADFLVLDVNGELRSVLVGNKVLISKLNHYRPRRGELVGIRRLGTVEPKTRNGRAYVDFAVYIPGRDDEALDWSMTKALPESDGEIVVTATPSLRRRSRTDDRAASACCRRA
jgi:hypothetical protein